MGSEGRDILCCKLHDIYVTFQGAEVVFCLEKEMLQFDV